MAAGRVGKVGLERVLNLSIVGAPNAGKSSLMNCFFPPSQRLAAVSPKYNTTRQRQRAILTEGDTQIIFTDTPGIIEQSDLKRFQRTLLKDAVESIEDDGTDAVLFLVDAAARLSDRRVRIVEKVRDLCANNKLDMLLVLNKVDLVKNKRELLPLTDRLVSLLSTETYAGPIQTHYISAKSISDNGMDSLKQSLVNISRPCPWYYDVDEFTDLTDEKAISEIIRDELFKTYQQEVPYSIVQETTVWEPALNSSKKLLLEQTLHVPTESIRRIVSGKGGSVIRKVSRHAKKRVSAFLSQDVDLVLSVKVTRGS
jgi:GTPase